jgi:electron transfer flavoprotein beta subunit
VKILVCIKRVPFTGGKMVLAEDSKALETRHLGFTMSPHEECGVEEAVRLIEANGGESVVLTLGPPEAVEQLRDAMAIGIDRAIHLNTAPARAQGADKDEEWDAQATAAAIVEAIRADESASGEFDLIFFGNESADSGGYQVGLRVGYGLGRPCATGLKGVKVEARFVRCEQDMGGARDVYVLPLPAIVTVKEGLNLPRYPSVPGRMRASRKPVVTSTPPRPESRLQLTRLAVPGGPGRRTELLGRGAAAAPAVVEMLKKAGIV